VNFLYPQNIFIVLAVLFIVLFNKKKTFTHLDFFKSKKFFTIPILDILILFSLGLMLMYPTKEITKKVSNISNFSWHKNKKKHYIILILDVSCSMKEINAFEKEKTYAKSIINSHPNDYIMLVVFEKDYKIVQYFTNNTKLLKSKIDSLKINMVTDIGGSMLRDTVAGIINAFSQLNPRIYVISDGSDNDSSSVTKTQIANLAKKVNISYQGYGDDENNFYYYKIFIPKHIKRQKPTYKNITTTTEIKYKVFDKRFAFITICLLLIKILRIKFENFSAFF